MNARRPPRRASPHPGSRATLAFLLIITGATLVVLGITLVWTGGINQVLPAPVDQPWVGFALTLLGLVLTIVGLLVDMRGAYDIIVRETPHLLPRIPLGANVALTIILALGATSGYHAVFDLLTGAHEAPVTSPSVDATDLLLADVIVANVVSYVAAAWVLLLMARIFQFGHAVDRNRRARAAQGGPLRLNPPSARPWLIAYTTTLFLTSQASMLRALEGGTSPASMQDWLFSLPGLALMIVLTALVFTYLDRGLRSFEADMDPEVVPLEDTPTEATPTAS